MKKIIPVIFLLTMISIKGNSQQFSAGFQSGIGTFSMQQLKKLNEAAMKVLPFDTKVVENFPIYFYYRSSILMKIKRISFGPVYTFQSTGSRISGKDYSGEYRFDMIINSSAPGIYAEVDFLEQNKLQFSFYSIFGVLLSSLRMKEYLYILEETVTDNNYKFKAFNMFAEPGFRLSYPVKFLDVGINAGYQIQFGNKSFYFIENKNAKLVNPESEDPVKPGWNGFRFGLSVFYTF